MIYVQLIYYEKQPMVCIKIKSMPASLSLNRLRALKAHRSITLSVKPVPRTDTPQSGHGSLLSEKDIIFNKIFRTMGQETHTMAS